MFPSVSDKENLGGPIDPPMGFDPTDFFLPDKVHIFWEGHKILQNLHLTFGYSTYSQKLGEDFLKFCGLLRIYELYYVITLIQIKKK